MSGPRTNRNDVTARTNKLVLGFNDNATMKTSLVIAKGIRILATIPVTGHEEVLAYLLDEINELRAERDRLLEESARTSLILERIRRDIS